MARPAPDPQERAHDIVDAATKVFARKGFRSAQMMDIAQEMGVSPGTLYNSVTNKDALFSASLQHIFGLTDDLPGLLKEETVDLVGKIEGTIAEAELFPVMAGALSEPVPTDPAKFRAQLQSLIEEQFDFMSRNGDGVRILEKSTTDFPELSRTYFGFLRARVIDRWESYLDDAKAAGHLADVKDAAIAARCVIEVISWWTIRIPTDPGTEHYDLSNVRSEVVAYALRGLV